eukprot:SAG11_NODE_7405_length_1148_cov_3.715920_1_plen_182_part_00
MNSIADRTKARKSTERARAKDGSKTVRIRRARLTDAATLHTHVNDALHHTNPCTQTSGNGSSIEPDLDSTWLGLRQRSTEVDKLNIKFPRAISKHILEPCPYSKHDKSNTDVNCTAHIVRIEALNFGGQKLVRYTEWIAHTRKAYTAHDHVETGLCQIPITKPNAWRRALKVVNITLTDKT